MIGKLTPERIWLYLYRCQLDGLVDPEQAARETDIAYQEYMRRFNEHKPYGRWYKGPYIEFRLRRSSILRRSSKSKPVPDF